MVPEYLDIPIFPLPNVTFFPRTLLPLHVFEPRYLKMIESALNGDRLLGVGLLRDGWEVDYFGNPPIFKAFGVGKIIEYDRLENGRYNIVVEGLYRVRLVTEHASSPFRTGRVSVMQDGPIDHLRQDVAAIQKELLASCRQLGDLLPESSESVQHAWAHPHPAVTADLLASSLVVDAYDRQCILEEPDPLRRMKLVLVQIRRVVYQLSQEKIEEEVREED